MRPIRSSGDGFRHIVVVGRRRCGRSGRLTTVSAASTSVVTVGGD